jgi:hypothetical protein
MIKLSIIKVFTVLLIVIFCGSSLLVQVRSFPGDKPAIVVEPALIKDPTLIPNSEFNISIKLYNATATTVPNGIQGVEIKLEWNNATLNLKSETSMLGLTGGVLNPTVLISKDEVGDDYYWLAGASIGNPWWGNGTIAAITFEVVGVGKTDIKLSFTDLVDASIKSVEHYVQGGSFDNRPSVPQAKVYVNPPQIVDSSLTPSNYCYVNVSIIDAVELAYFSFNMSFNSTILEVVEAQWGWAGPSPQVDNILGIINGSSTIYPTITGNATLVRVKFHVKNIGESVLHLFDLALLDTFGETLPFTTSDGYFNNMLITKIFVDPPYRMDPYLRPGNITLFDIMGENFIDVKLCEFYLIFNPKVIKAISVFVNPINNFIVDAEIEIKNTIGLLHVNITYDPPVYSSRAKIMNVTFQVVGYGVSSLDLNETKLYDSSGNAISHETEDGLLITVIRDVAIIDIIPVPQKVYPNRKVTVYVIARNMGNISETFTVSAYIDDTVLLGTITVTDLSPATNVTLTFYWDTTGLPYCHWHSLSANASFVPYEIDTTNNLLSGPQIKIKIWGDINGDGTVNLSDIVLLANAYNSTVGDPRYNSEADLDNDGKVSLTDLVTCALYYNHSC